MKELIVTGATIKRLDLPKEEIDVVFVRDVRIEVSLDFIGSGDFSEYIGNTEKLSMEIMEKLIYLKIVL